MLTNTLSIFLRDVAPLFLLCSMLAAMLSNRSFFRLFLSGFSVGTVFTLLYFVAEGRISQWMDGSGSEIVRFLFEILKVACYLTLLLRLIRFSDTSSKLLIVALLAFSTLTSSPSFLTYFGSVVSVGEVGQSLLLGVIVGVGISVSLSILCYFFVIWCKGKCELVVYLIPALYFSGHFSHSFRLLEQIGAIDGREIWSTEHWLADNHDVAQLLNGLIGYESTPTSWQVGSQLIVTTLFIIVVYLRKETLARAARVSEVSL